MTTATQEGRNLHIHVDGVDPYIVKPLGGDAGKQMTDTYLRGALGQASGEEISNALVMALDGAVRDGDLWVPVPLEQRTNANRIGEELRLEETDSVAMAAFFWQTILGMAGVNAFLEHGGVAGHTKAMGALVARLGISPQRTSPSSALEDLTQLLGSTPSMSTPLGGPKPGRQPQDRQPKKRTKPKG